VRTTDKGLQNRDLRAPVEFLNGLGNDLE
jgi:hypothetical protein